MFFFCLVTVSIDGSTPSAGGLTNVCCPGRPSNWSVSHKGRTAFEQVAALRCGLFAALAELSRTACMCAQAEGTVGYFSHVSQTRTEDVSNLIVVITSTWRSRSSIRKAGHHLTP